MFHPLPSRISHRRHLRPPVWLSLRQPTRPTVSRRFVPSSVPSFSHSTQTPRTCPTPPVFLSDSEFIDDLDHIIRRFDTTTKIRFRNPDDIQYIKFGSTRDNDRDHDIRFGQLKVAGNKVAKFFTPSVRCTVDAVVAQTRLARSNITVCYLRFVLETTSGSCSIMISSMLY